jgi:poly(A) polymerase
MLQRRILEPVLPEVELGQVRCLEALIHAEREAAIEPDPLRRLSALLPRQPETADEIGARLRLSNRARKRLACAAEEELFASDEVLAYRVGGACAVDRLLLAGKAEEAARIVGWKAPRLPIGGGALIARGLPEGPIVARTLKRIEDQWVNGGFPTGPDFDRIVTDALAGAR